MRQLLHCTRRVILGSRTDPIVSGLTIYIIIVPWNRGNTTAVLHAGHGLNQTLQDVLIRYQRMRGRKALWVPGTDHAGIATQNVVEKQLVAEGTTRFELGREALMSSIFVPSGCL